MTTAIIGLGVAYAFLVALVLNLCFRSPWSFWLKLTSVALAATLYFVAYSSLTELLGWPNKSENLPSRFQLVSAIIIEPPKQTLDEERQQTIATPLTQNKGQGMIFLWILSLESDRPGSEPRAYEVPYSLKMHKIVSAALDRISQGLPQIGETEKISARGETLELFASDELQIKIYDVPAPELPGK